MLKEDRVTALGAMSGTSLDGVDAAVIETDGETIFDFGPTAFLAYTAQEQTVLRSVMGEWSSTRVAAAAEVVETAHARVLSRFENVDLIGFHGQTVAHDPDNRRTHQIGHGQVLAEVLQRPVVWDFRSADVKLGGQGAPLAPFYHFALAKYLKLDAPVALLNLGGVGNVTFVDPRKANPTDDGALLAFDTGPANAPINDLMMRHFDVAFDRDGAIARTGSVDAETIQMLLRDPYFARVPPKSLDRNAFDPFLQRLADLPSTDAIATATRACVAAVVNAVAFFPQPVEQILACGGGRKNATVMEGLADGVTCPVAPVDDVGLNGDMLEAQAFAFLAVRVAKGWPTSCPTTTAVSAAVGGGTVSRPSAT